MTSDNQRMSETELSTLSSKKAEESNEETPIKHVTILFVVTSAVIIPAVKYTNINIAQLAQSLELTTVVRQWTEWHCQHPELSSKWLHSRRDLEKPLYLRDCILF